MKTKILTTTIISTVLALSTADSALAAGRKAGKRQQAAPCRLDTAQSVNAAPSAALSAEDQAHLLFMREEEKLARDVYLAMFALWQADIFFNIANSEQRHMDAILNLLDKYGIPDPAGDEGVFQNAELQELYDDLVAIGSNSLLDALMVGALIEEVDIEDLELSIAATTQSDLLRVYSNLLSASGQHLRAFAANIEAITGEPYAAQHLSDEAVAAILSKPSKGRQRRKGRR